MYHRNHLVFGSKGFDLGAPIIEKPKANWTKILVGRHPFERLYSGWNDKSRTFRFPNGTYDLSKAAKETTWLWGETNLTKTEEG